MPQIMTFFTLGLIALSIAGCSTVEQAAPVQKREARPIQRPAEDVFDDTQARTVRVFSGYGLRRASGAGVVVSYRGHHFVLTALHVVTDPTSATDQKAFERLVTELKTEVEFWNNERSTPIYVIAVPLWDIAIIGPLDVPTSVKSSRFLDEVDSRSARVGDAVIVWGAPYGYGPVPLIGRYNSQTMTWYSVIRDGKKEAIPGALAFGMTIDVGAQPGNSGGPLFDLKGRLLGVVSTARLANDGIFEPIANGYELSTYWKLIAPELDKYLLRSGLVTTPSTK